MKHIYSKKNRALLAELVRTDFKIRYQGSALGYTWTLLRPLLLFAILYLVFVQFIRLGEDVPHFPVYLLLGIVIWNFFSEVTSRGLTSIVERGDLIRKITIPRWIIILSISIAALINLAINMLVVGVFMVINGVEFSWFLLWLPLILLQVYLLALGLSAYLSAAYVKYRDVSYIWEVVLQAGFYLTPILYPMTLITNPEFQKLLLLNPMAQAIQDARYVSVTEVTVTVSQVFDNGIYMLIPYILTLTILIMGVWYFKKESKNFAENV